MPGSSRSRCIYLQCLVALVVTVFTPGVASAQVLYGSLLGMVHDSSGAVVPAGAVTVVNTGTGQSLNAVTDSAGGYSFPNLLPGRTILR